MSFNLNRRHYSTRRLRWALGGFFVALALPAVVLVYSSYKQLKWEAFHQQRTAALELTEAINADIQAWLAQEESRSFSDYQFLVVTGDSTTNFLQPSILAADPPPTALPGALGYFQVDADGHLNSPLLPASAKEASYYGISAADYARREQRFQSIQKILSDNRLIQLRREVVTDTNPAPRVTRPPDVAETSALSDAAPAPAMEAQEESTVVAQETVAAEPAPAGRQSQQAFDNLLKTESEARRAPKSSAGKAAGDQSGAAQAVSTMAEDKDVQLMKEALQNYQQRQSRKEQNLLPRPQPAAPAEPAAPVQITMFESEVDPFVMSMLNSGHLVLFRKVWREGERFTQGLLFERDAFLRGAVLEPFAKAGLSNQVDLAVAFRESVVMEFAATPRVYGDYASHEAFAANREMAGEPLLQTALAEPFNHIRLLYSVNELPLGPGGRVIAWTALVMAVVLALGTLLMYRLGTRQIRLAQQQQDFVSAVSHELKTPLTSIRMYGEMLRAGWADENKKRQYYDFIYDESERLSRLIANVLQLARMNRRELDIAVKTVPVAELLDNLASKLTTQVERAGFELVLERDPAVERQSVVVDRDSFLQVMINLVDNALKFSRQSAVKRIDLQALAAGQGEVMFSVRDYGPGIAKNHLKKIFDLFYRAESELTRETVGTGIGLALVHQLVRAMGGRVDVVNREPGAEFRVFLPVSV